MPVRNLIGKGVVWLFKRGAYKVEDEVQKFIRSIGVSDNVPVLDKFTGFVKNLLGPSEILIIDMRKDADNSISQGEGYENLIRKDAGSLCEYFTHNKKPAYGFELIDMGVLREGLSREIHNAVFVPIFLGSDVRYTGVLFRKWNNAAYFKRDMQLLDTISADISHCLEAENMRRVRVEMETKMRREREEVMKEMHDGLGSILTNITVASQVAGQVFEADIGNVQVRFSRNGTSGNGNIPMTVEIADDGRGFVLERDRDRGGMGLRNIARRIENLGGSFEIKTTVGKGTNLVFTVPLG